ncbi:MAG: class I SAM-dependent methyltransferase [Spirochaetales bacterium]
MSWWDAAYRSGRIPWDPGAYDGHLSWVLERFDMPGGRVLDAGCGTGKSAVWLAERGFDVVGIDLSPAAVAQARRLAETRAVGERARFYEGRFPDRLPGAGGGTAGSPGAEPARVLTPGSFDLVIERAFLQHVGRGSTLQATVDILSRLLRSGGYLYSLMIASEGARGFGGITRWSKQQIQRALEPSFRIDEMHLDVFTPGESGSVPAWITLARVNARVTSSR